MGVFRDQTAGDWAGSVFGAPMGCEAGDITPWRKSLHQILLGFAMCMVRVNHLELERIMPVIGSVLLFLGFRTLRQESKWFRLGFLLSCARGIFLLADVLVSSSIWIETVHSSVIYEILVWGFRGMLLGVLLCFRQGIRGVLTQAGRVADTKSADALTGLYVLSVLIDLLGDNVIVSYAQIGLFALALWMLYRLLRQLSEAGYDVYTCLTHPGDILTSVFIVAVAVVFLLVGSLGMCRFPMQWQPHESDTGAHISAFDKLQKVDDELLADLSEADAADFRDAVSVNVFQTDYGFAEDWVTPASEPSLRITVIFGRLPDKDGSYESRSVIFCHFKWLNEYGYGGTDGISVPLRDLVPVNCRGQVLYDQDGMAYRADMVGVAVKNEEKVPVVSGAFSLPAGGKNCRGYIRMDVDGMNESLLYEWAMLNQSNVRYIHHYPLPQLPFLTGEDYALAEDEYVYDPQFRQAKPVYVK